VMWYYNINVYIKKHLKILHLYR